MAKIQGPEVVYEKYYPVKVWALYPLARQENLNWALIHQHGVSWTPSWVRQYNY